MGALASKCRGIAVALVLFHTAVLSGCTLLLPALPLLVIPGNFSRRLFRRWAQIIQEAWFGFACGLLHYVLGIKFVLNIPKELGDLNSVVNSCEGRNVVIMCNHRTRVDWMFLWGLCLITGRLGSMKIVLKESLKRAPGFGWAMQCFGFAFLSRKNKEHDLAQLQSTVTHHCTDDGPGLTLVIFPEGTDLSKSNVEICQAFAKEKGLVVYNEVLHPKVVGLCAALEAATASGLEAPLLMDVTIAYAEFAPGERPSEKSLFSGRPPTEVHFRLDSLSPIASQKAGESCKLSFAKKEERLAKVYKDTHINGGAADMSSFSNGCEAVSFGSAGSRPRIFFSSVAYLVLEAGCLWASVNFIRRASALGFATALTFELLFRKGGVDAFEKSHAQRWPSARAKQE